MRAACGIRLSIWAAREKNYLETSGSAIMAYALLKGVRLGIHPESYVEYAKEAIDGICDKYLKTKEGEMSLGGISFLLPDLAVKTEDRVHMIITCQNQSLKMMQRVLDHSFLHIQNY